MRSKRLYLTYYLVGFIPIFLLSLGCSPKTDVQIKGVDKEVKIDSRFRLMAHRGGVTDNGKHSENSLAALDEAIQRGYTGVEIDVRQSKDGKLFLYHNRTFEQDYDTKLGAEDLTWTEIQSLRPLKTGVAAPISLEEYTKYCMGKMQDLMIDIKIKEPSQEFYQELERVLIETNFLKSSYFIGHGEYFRGKAHITMLMREMDEFFKIYGDKTRDYYFLFAGFDEINAKTIKWCNENGIKVMACVNRPYYENSNHMEEAGKNARYLIEWGVVDYQLDSDYDVYLEKTWSCCK